MRKLGTTRSERLESILVFCLLILCVAALIPRYAITAQPAHLEMSGMSDPNITNSSGVFEARIPQNGSYPLGLTTDREGNVWFSESNTDSINMFSPSNGTFRSFHIPTQSHLALIWFLVFDNAGNLWFADNTQALIWRFSPTSDQFANFTTGSANQKPFGLAYDPKRNTLWFSALLSNQIGEFQVNPDESATLVRQEELPQAPGSVGGDTGPGGIAIDASGNVFVTQSFVGQIAEFSPVQNSFVHTWVLPPGSEPEGIAVNSVLGRVWFTDHGSSLFGYVDESSGHVTEIPTSQFAYSSSNGLVSVSISLPYWIEFGANGTIWLDEHAADKIARFDPTSGILTEFQVPTFDSEPIRISIDNARGLLWFSEFSGNKIGMIEENASLESSVSLLNRTVTLGSSSESILARFANGSSGINSFSGSFSKTGSIDSNLSVSVSELNSTVSKITISRGPNLSAGNFSLSACNNELVSSLNVTHCSVVFVSVENPSMSSMFGIPLNESYVLGGAIIAAALVVSLFYVKRWRRD